MVALEATCHTPIGAHAVHAGGGLRLTAFVGLPDGSHWIRDELDGDPDAPAELGRAVAERLLSAGAAELLAGAEQMAGARLAFARWPAASSTWWARVPAIPG